MSKRFVRVPRGRALAALMTHAACVMAVLALIAATHANAACSSFQPQRDATSAMAGDAACTHSDIQPAIDAATCVHGTNICITHEQACASQHLNFGDKNVALIGRADGDVCGPVSRAVCNAEMRRQRHDILQWLRSSTNRHLAAGTCHLRTCEITAGLSRCPNVMANIVSH